MQEKLACGSTAEIAVGGMTCGACTSAVTGALEQLSGVSYVNVSLVSERATVKFNGPSVADLVAAVEDAGFDAQVLNVKSDATTRKLEVAIEGMTCASCSTAVTQAVEKLEDVKSVEVSLATDTATIQYYKNAENPFPARATEAIEDAGFDARILSDKDDEVHKHAGKPLASTNDSTFIYIEGEAEADKNSQISLQIFGMNDALSVEAMRKALSDIDGVYQVVIDMYAETGTAVIDYDRTKTGVRVFVRCIEDHNCTALVASTADNSQQLNALKRVKVVQGYRRDTIIAYTLGVPCIILMKLRDKMPSFLTSKIFRGVWVDDIIGILMVLPVLLGPARRFYSKSYKALKARAPTMDVLVTTSVTCAFTYSLVALFHSVYSDMQTHQMYLWDACAMILMFVILGKYLENVARGHTSKALTELISLVPEKALVVAPDTSENGELMATDMLQVGDVVILRPGERVSADGVVVEGESRISESLITGESKLVRKKAGDSVIGGTINGMGSLRFRVTSCGADTKLSQIVTFIKEAQGSRAPIQRYADYAAARFVPIILCLAFGTFTGWFLAGTLFGVERLPHMFQNSLFFMCLRLAIAVIVVACPCALGLATPMAVMVGTGVGAEHGILVRGGSIFEAGAHVSVVLFDKTGTLTTGKMSVTSTTVASEHWPKIRALEAASEHPAGRAIASYRHPDETPHVFTGVVDQDALIHPDHIKAFPGEGIQGQFGAELMFVGRRHRDKQLALRSAGTGIEVVINGESVGNIELQDSLRSDAPAVVEMLKSQGKTVGIVSGDSKQAVDSIAQALDIDEEYTWSLMKPEDKVHVIKGLQAEGHEVAFVGDGVNDTPALVSASVGISLEGATHVAVESADIVLTQKSPIAAVPGALDLCRATMRRIKINLFASIIYNALMVPLAMGLLLPFHIMLSPMLASAAMSSSSVSVVISSWLLTRWKPLLLDEQPPLSKTNWWTRLLSKLRLCRQPQYQPV